MSSEYALELTFDGAPIFSPPYEKQYDFAPMTLPRPILPHFSSSSSSDPSLGGSSVGSASFVLSPAPTLSPISPYSPTDDPEHVSLFAAMQDVYLNDGSPRRSPVPLSPMSPTKRLSPPLSPLGSPQQLRRHASTPALYLDAARSGKTLAARRASRPPLRRPASLVFQRDIDAVDDIRPPSPRPTKFARRTPPMLPTNDAEMDALMADIGEILATPDQADFHAAPRPKPLVLPNHQHTAPAVLSLAEAQAALAGASYQPAPLAMPAPSYNCAGVKLAHEDLGMLNDLPQQQIERPVSAPVWQQSFPTTYTELAFPPRRPSMTPANLPPSFQMRRGSSADQVMMPAMHHHLSAHYVPRQQAPMAYDSSPAGSYYPSSHYSPLDTPMRRRSSLASHDFRRASFAVSSPTPRAPAAPTFINFSAADATTINRGVAKSGASKMTEKKQAPKRVVSA